MIKNILNFIIGDSNKKALKNIQPLISQINEIYEKYKQELTDQNAILAKTSEFKQRVKDGETLDQILPEAFALVKTACHHLKGKSWDVNGKSTTWDMVPYDVQLIGGAVIHQGNVAEMRTGEGKTLVCTLPCYLNALTEKGVFVVTVNEYLAERDAQWMEGLYNYLGLSVGIIKSGMAPKDKQAAYKCDITYGTNNEFGFDYLRDNMTTNKENIVQRHLHFAIVDEVDSILIDEARTPLIISAPAAQSTSKYENYSRLINQLTEHTDYEIDEKAKQATLTEDGIAKMEQLLGIDNIYTDAGFAEVHHIQQALRAKACYQKDTDYIVKDDQVIIIDEFTGRLMEGRRYGQGLHQAIEAKEGVEIKRESKTLATVSFQNYFRLFDKLAGMTGTAKTEEEEFYQIYGLETVVIPTNRPIARQDRTDAIFKNMRGKFTKLAADIKEIHQTGQPILVGTVSVEKSEVLSKLLKAHGVPHNVLNAKNHAKEAEIVEKAGQKGAVTIATNMAGRGTDIKLGDEVKELGGLYVIGTERHESRRIDNQLRGRSGRQGDPGTSQFYVSMEDDLMRKFGAERIQNMMNALKVPEDMPIENRLISRSIESAQKKVEGHNFDIRKHLVEYDDVMNIHRNIIYKRRQEVLKKDDIKEIIQAQLDELVEILVSNHTGVLPKEQWELQEIYEAIQAIHKSSELKPEDLKKLETPEEIKEHLQKHLRAEYDKREAQLEDPKILRQIEKFIHLRTIDRLWMDHIDEMSRLRQFVAFSGYAQKQPLNEYKSQGYEMFQNLQGMILNQTINTLFKVDLEKVLERQKQAQQIKEQQAQNNSTNPVVVKASAANKNNAQVQEGEVGRNDECTCGSGKKYKKCCGK